MTKVFSALVLLWLFFWEIPAIALANPDQQELKRAIEEKTKEIQQLHQQIQQTQQNLIDTEKKERTLKQEVSKFNYTISQLGLSIKSSEISIEKLKLEIASLNENIDKTQEEIELKQEAINKILREMQIRDNEDLVVVFLKNQSLAEGLAELHNLKEIKNALANDIGELQNLKNGLSENKTQISGKKSKVEIEHQSAKARKKITEEQKIERSELLALTKNQEKAYSQLLNELSKKQTEIAEEIEKIEATLRRQINPDLIPPERPGVLGWPLDDGFKKLTQNYGATKFARYGYKGRWHNGIDIGDALGTPILAAEDGTVVNIGDQDLFCRKGAYGKYIVIRHANNLVTLYAHLSRQAVSPGDRVSRGQVIGYMGSTGYSTGSHLHFTVYDANTFQMRQSVNCGLMPSGGDINPMVYL